MFVGDRRLQLSMIVSQTDIKSATLALVTGKLAEARSQLIACPPQVMLGAKRRQMPLVPLLARMMTKVSAATCCHLQLLLLQHRRQYRRRQMFRQLLVGDRRLQWSMIVSQLDIKSAALALVTGKLAEARSQLVAGPPQAMVGANRRQIPLIMLARWMTRVCAATCRHLPSLQLCERFEQQQ